MERDPLVFFKWLRIGDYAQSLPSITPEHDPIEPRSGLGAQTGRVIGTTGAATRLRIAVKHALRQAQGESDRSFFGRRLDYAAALREVVGKGNGFKRGGLLVAVDAEATDVTALASPSAAGSSIDLDLTADVGIQVGDPVYITDGTGAAEVVTAEVGTTSTTLTCSPTLDWAAGVTVARVLWWAEEAFCGSLPAIEMHHNGSTRNSRDLELEFLVVKDIQHAL